MTTQELGKPAHPFWTKQEQCLWCNAKADVNSSEVSEDEDTVIVRYRCENGQCTYPLPDLFEFGVRFKGRAYIEQYKKFNKPAEKEEEAK